MNWPRVKEDAHDGLEKKMSSQNTTLISPGRVVHNDSLVRSLQDLSVSRPSRIVVCDHRADCGIGGHQMQVGINQKKGLSKCHLSLLGLNQLCNLFGNSCPSSLELEQPLSLLGSYWLTRCRPCL